jgi:6-phosphogluconolactonase (cycloisomerase 2 family)
MASGGLTALDPVISTSDTPTSVAIDHQGRFAYVTNAGAGTVSVYSINTTTGALTLTTTATAGSQPIKMILDANDKFAYVANIGSDNVSTFAVDSTTGALTAVGQPVNAENAPAWVTLIQ